MNEDVGIAVFLIVVVILIIGGVSCGVGNEMGYTRAMTEWVGPDEKENSKYYIDDKEITCSETQHAIYEYYVEKE